MNLFATIFASVFLMTSTANAQVDNSKAEAFVEKVTAEGIEEIINANISQEKKTQRFEKLFNDALDLDFIGQFVLGRYWKTSSPKQQKEFIKVYKELNIKTWSARFDEFKGHSFTFNGTTPSNSANQVFVNSVVPMGEGEPAKVVFRVKQSGNSFKIVDIIIENVSLAITARNEYAAFIKNHPTGVDALISDLKTKVNQQ